MRSIIVDDEQVFRDMLADLIEESLPMVEIVERCSNAEQAFLAIKKLEPDLVFLDVEMTGMTGLELLEQFPDRSFEVIFTTSHDKYALKALKQEAAEYLIKPVNVIELVKAVEKVQRKLRQRSARAESAGETNESKMIALHTGDGIGFYDVQNIVRCESETNYTTFYFVGGEKIVITKQFKDVEAMLLPHGFYRPHKSHLINTAFIKKAYKGESAYIVMQDGSTIPISRQRKDEFWARYGL